MSNAPTSLCPKCGQPFDPSRATYDNSGNLQCNACAAQGQIAVAEGRASASVVSAAGGILAGGIASLFCFNPLGLVSLVTAISGASWLVMVGGNRSLRESIGSRYTGALVMTIIGTVLSSLALAAVGLKMLGIVLSL